MQCQRGSGQHGQQEANSHAHPGKAAAPRFAVAGPGRRWPGRRGKSGRHALRTRSARCAIGRLGDRSGPRPLCRRGIAGGRGSLLPRVGRRARALRCRCPRGLLPGLLRAGLLRTGGGWGRCGPLLCKYTCGRPPVREAVAPKQVRGPKMAQLYELLELDIAQGSELLAVSRQIPLDGMFTAGHDLSGILVCPRPTHFVPQPASPRCSTLFSWSAGRTSADLHELAPNRGNPVACGRRALDSVHSAPERVPNASP